MTSAERSFRKGTILYDNLNLKDKKQTNKHISNLHFANLYVLQMTKFS